MLFKIGERYVNTAYPSCVYIIVFISPKVDYNGERTYFLEVEDAGDTYYTVEYENQFKEWYEKI
ncbi:hypothetical protein ACDN41_12080 [Priestia aryabhattai]|uniref:hypothetical protein n=1 Tax=Priestia aryabhattai TaxID=412384 RepID=UPI00353267D6